MAIDGTNVPRVGVGCIVVQDGKILLVKTWRGLWSAPGGNLEIGETPADCAIRETLEETGVTVTNARFVAITNDIMPDIGRHYVTIWMRADPSGELTTVRDTREILEVAWFRPAELPDGRLAYFDNLLSGRCQPNPPFELSDILPPQRG